MVDWVARLLALGVWVTGIALTGAGTAHADDDRRLEDARTVYCLQAKHRADLIQAAAALRLASPAPSPPPRPSPAPRPASPARPSPSPSPSPAPSPSFDGHVMMSGTPVPAQVWSTASPSAFARACAALIGAVPSQLKEPAGPWPGIVGGMVPVVIGGLLTLAATSWHVRRDRTAKVAAELRTAAVAYRRAAGEYMDEWLADEGDQPVDTQVRSALLDLETQLSLVCAMRLRGAARSRRLLGELRGQREVPWGTAGEWHAATDETGGREGFRTRCAEAIGRVADRANDLAATVERLVPRWPAKEGSGDPAP
ncbi:hypothetical protein [Streptosporangium sp. KLBMP 9127]|nr:hypothetical protein [Streptosporangium sp. KLBMP 9127]